MLNDIPKANINTKPSFTIRGVQGICLAVTTTPLYHRYSALKSIKYQTLSLHVSNVGGLEQATAFPF